MRTGLSALSGGQGAPSGEGTSGAAPAGGHGLAGMRERLRLVGGSLTAGPLAEGWTVRAEVPS